MSHRKSKLGVRKPIPSTGHLVADQSKYNGLDTTFTQLVEWFLISPARTIAIVKLICGHTYGFQPQDLGVGIIWDDIIPHSMQCVACEDIVTDALKDLEDR